MAILMAMCKASESPIPKTQRKRKSDPDKLTIFGNLFTGRTHQKGFLPHALGYSAFTELCQTYPESRECKRHLTHRQLLEELAHFLVLVYRGCGSEATFPYTTRKAKMQVDHFSHGINCFTLSLYPSILQCKSRGRHN